MNMSDITGERKDFLGRGWAMLTVPRMFASGFLIRWPVAFSQELMMVSKSVIKF